MNIIELPRKNEGLCEVSEQDLPCLIPNMSFRQYLDDPVEIPSATSSLVRDLLSMTPRAVWHNTKRLNPDAPTEQKTIFDLGSAAHAAFVGEGDPIEEIPFSDYRTKEARQARDTAYAQGHTPVLTKDMHRVEVMASAALDQFNQHKMLKHVLDNSQTLREASIFWQSMVGAYCRCRPDLYLPDEKEPVIIHYKTTGTTLQLNTIDRFAADSKWDLIAAHYEDGVHRLTGHIPVQLFAVQETKPPHLCMVVKLSESFMVTARRRHERALRIWVKCLKSGNWPMHILDSSILIDPPEWHQNRQLKEENDEEDMIENTGKDILQAMSAWYAP